MCHFVVLFFFFFNDTATTEIYTLSLHDALPILVGQRRGDRSDRCAVRSAGGRARSGSSARGHGQRGRGAARLSARPWPVDRKSTRLNSSHANISYAVFCLKKKKTLKVIRLIVRT